MRPDVEDKARCQGQQKGKREGYIRPLHDNTHLQVASFLFGPVLFGP